MIKAIQKVKRFSGVVLATTVVLTTTLLIYLMWSALNWAFPLPQIHSSNHSVNVLASDGQVLRQFADQNGIFRTPVHLDKVSQTYIDTLLMYEDKHFFNHGGVDVSALVRAVGQRITSGRVISGGSTLTMQVARLLYSYERSYSGKLVQIFRALQLESQYSKETILELYLTFAPMGGNIEGVEAASQRYFGKSANELNITESALLAVLPQRPSRYRPDRYPNQAKNARNKVLRRLVQNGKLTQEEYQLLWQEPILSQRKPIKKDAPLLARELKKAHPNSRQIDTYINSALQSNISDLTAQRFTGLNHNLSVALLVMKNQTGKVIAYKGSLDIDDVRSFGHVDMTKAVRSPGSTLKPFIYAHALEAGLIHSESLLLDIPTNFGDYQPKNFNQQFQGSISVAEALQRSKNIAPVYLLNRLGVKRFAQQLEVLDASLRLPNNNLTVALGGGGSSLRELVMFYSAFARGGIAIKPRMSIQDTVQQASIMTKESAWITKTILEDIRPPDRTRAKFGRKIAWKTGTSYGFRDAWALGLSSDYTVGVWVGRPNGSPYAGQTGATQAAPLLFDVFDLLPIDTHPLLKPKAVVQTDICWPSGLDAKWVRKAQCQLKRTAWTIDGITPRTLRSDNQIEQIHHWPKALSLWRQSTSQNQQTIEILTPQDGSHIFPYPGQVLNLRASSRHVRWYLDDAVIGDSLHLDKLDGKHRISSCNTVTCKVIEITVH
ncbi:penicillin-binding protein 1C [Vibrio sagamiensis]|uniref:peptidoglycan glycosyltransferase n=1 Tax=Vibrio sagamiensis NBRC 104589 TaxID=1219064 RepID=A0A511QC92_9VIBR|nr:penicillin-binding protein 1C [Vibrio sagamiensis]PNQ71815.1 penicillin-binding protein 1C [Vibrio agarivorans]GEM74826.1 penicillin-binding protein 1C [Vibrio sagamiensis NBRC 104589]